jgi:tRNA G18 (ribose-2'-O)-methylase SpoU
MVKNTETATNPKGVVLALGSEGEGVPDDALKHASQTVAIRTPNGDGSPLNVSAAGAILMYALAP